MERGKLDPDRKLDIALEGSMLTSEPPQIAEPTKAGETERDDGRTRPAGSAA